VAFEDSVMTVYVLMIFIAVKQNPLYKDSSIGPPELLSGLFVPIEFLSCCWPYQHCLGFKGYEFCRQVTVYVSGVSIADTTLGFES
jgi:hypothetical protein